MDRYFGVECQSSLRQTVFYCRVSRRAQQADRPAVATAGHGDVLSRYDLAVDEWLTKVGSGLDFKRPEHRALMERIEGRGIGLLLVAHEDRLWRLGFDWFEYFADTHGCEIRVVNYPSLLPQAELVEHLMSVIHTFSDRLSGSHRYRKQIRVAP